MKLERVFILAALGLAATAPAQLVNASFEEPSLPNGTFNASGITGWSVSGESGVWNIPSASFFTIEAPHGTQIGYSNGNFVAQQASISLVEGLNGVSLQAGRRSDGFAGSFDLQLWVGGTVSSGAVVTGGEMIASTSFNHLNVAPTSFTLIEANFVAQANDPRLGQALSVRMVKTAGSQMNWDDVQMTAVPEPTTLGILALGAAAALRRRNRK